VVIFVWFTVTFLVFYNSHPPVEQEKLEISHIFCYLQDKDIRKDKEGALESNIKYSKMKIITLL